MDPSGPSLSVQICFLVVLTLLNAVFASAESAFVSSNKNKIKILANEGNKKAALLLDLMDEPARFISRIQVAVTFLRFLACAAAARGLCDELSKYLMELEVPYATQISVVGMTILLAYVTLVFGELFPKRLAMQNAEIVALRLVRPIYMVSKVLIPFAGIISVTISILMKLSGRDSYQMDGEYSEEEVKSMLDVGTESGQLDEAGREMIESVFDFDDELAYEIMTPRTDVYMIDINDPLEEYLDELLEERYSRIPVYDEDSDDIIGILYMKDFFIEARKVGFEHVDIRPLLQKPYFVPESKKINELFDELQRSKMHIAMLIDEYGGFSGIVTTEDIIEEIVGSLDDEYDDNEPEMELLEENTYLVDGQYPLDDLSDELEIHLDSENHETIGGLIIELLGEIPDEEEDEGVVVEYENYTFTIVEIKDRRIEKLKMEIHSRSDEEVDSDNEEKDDD